MRQKKLELKILEKETAIKDEQMSAQLTEQRINDTLNATYDQLNK